MKRRLCLFFPCALCLLLAACLVSPYRPSAPASTPGGGKAKTVPAPQGGGYYKDDGPGREIPDNLDDIPDAAPRQEPLHRGANKPYTVLGKKYTPQTQIRPFRQEGVASWYGKKFHGQKTSIGETYDMFAMTAAHPTLPLPSYARVTNPANGRRVVVRVNDRGPFHAGRIIDLSYVAAHKLDYVNAGSSRVIVETIIPGQTLPASEPAPTVAAAPVEPVRDSRELDALSLALSREEEAAVLPAGFYLQLGAFSLPENAENLKSHLLHESGWPDEAMHIHYQDNLHRLQMGPYPSRASAQEAAGKIHALSGYTPLIRALQAPAPGEAAY
ncbi:MAG: septal ring lytic transglycosylase RlpA family protein [Zoogloeaceae bacterium]|jgi:rare lipoprotein A|nr:septal ring lytic transglycosylase RlpA family protein [Zoogloeaceae bacterium]